MSSKYTYVKKVNPSRLTQNIEDSSITEVLNYINTKGNNVSMFNSFLPNATCLGDLLDKDGYNDILTCNYGDGSISISRNNDGVYAPLASTYVAPMIRGMVTADFDKMRCSSIPSPIMYILN